MYFSAKIFLQNKNGINEKMRGLYRHPALVPVMDWIDATPPSPPAINSAGGSQRTGVEIRWEDAVLTDASYYVIYRFDPEEKIKLDDPANIQAIVPRSSYNIQSWTDRNISKRTRYTYIVTAVDRLHNESSGSNTLLIRTRGRKGSLKVYKIFR